MFLLLTACAPAGPEPIRWGTDTCDLCRMVLTDRYFAAEFVDDRGSAHKFDGVDELARYLAAHPGPGKAYVIDGGTDTLVPAERAVFLHSPDLRGPMGGHTVTFARREEAERFAGERQLKSVRWLTYNQALAQERGGTAHGGH